MILLADIGNTHTHVGLATQDRIIKHANLSTSAWLEGDGEKALRRFIATKAIDGVAFCSVVPKATIRFRECAKKIAGNIFELLSTTVCSIGINYPRPQTIGPDRLANSIAATHLFGAPVVVVDFGTAVTFDVVDAKRNYVGGIIAPGLSAMTEYLHEKTALLPRIRVRETGAVIGKNTRQAMLIGATRGYRGLIRSLLSELRREIGVKTLPVIATGGYGRLIAAKLPEISATRPLLTLEGVLLAWNGRRDAPSRHPEPPSGKLRPS